MSSSASSPRRPHLHKAPALAQETGPGGGRAETLPLPPSRLPQPPAASPGSPALSRLEMQIHFGPASRGAPAGRAAVVRAGRTIVGGGGGYPLPGRLTPPGGRQWTLPGLGGQVNRLQRIMC